MDRQLFLLDAMIDAALEAALAPIQRAGLCVVLDLAPQASMARGDSAAITRSLVELLQRAASLSAHAGVVKLAVRAGSDGMTTLTVSVAAIGWQPDAAGSERGSSWAIELPSADGGFHLRA